jgi:hypothetical protein
VRRQVEDLDERRSGVDVEEPRKLGDVSSAVRGPDEDSIAAVFQAHESGEGAIRRSRVLFETRERTGLRPDLDLVALEVLVLDAPKIVAGSATKPEGEVSLIDGGCVSTTSDARLFLPDVLREKMKRRTRRRRRRFRSR